MRLPNSRRSFRAWKTKTVRTLCALSFDYPKRELRQPFFRIGKGESKKIEIHHALRFSCKLFRHERLTASHSFPIDVTLGLAGHIVAHSRKIIAFSKISHWPVVRPVHKACGKLNVSSGFRINNVALRRSKFL